MLAVGGFLCFFCKRMCGWWGGWRGWDGMGVAVDKAAGRENDTIGRISGR